MRKRFPALADLCGYFHEEWATKAEDDIGVLNAFKEDQTPATLRRTEEELDAFLSLPISDEEMTDIVVLTFGCRYNPDAFGFGMRDWLARVREELARA
jgi:hypothetical protein